MAGIRGNYYDCVFLNDGYYGASAIENDPDIGCMTYSSSVITENDDRWDDEEDEFKADV